MKHIPVMKQEVVEWLKPDSSDGVIVDCTAGYGGHSQALTEGLNERGTLIGIDRDEMALKHCKQLFAEAPFQTVWYHGGFEDLDQAFLEAGKTEADSILFDCGFSSPQIDEGSRGFSFMREGPLDMRMDTRQSLSAFEIINTWDVHDMANAFNRYGDEKFSRKIAKEIVKRRQIDAIESTQELADIVIQAIPQSYKKTESIHPATRVFQALRIVVNNELESLRNGLQHALDHLKPGGRVGVLSYHSLEHRIVKEKFHRYCGNVELPRWAGVVPDELKPKGKIITRKPVKPCAAEINLNPRSRSAQFRVLERLQDE